MGSGNQIDIVGALFLKFQENFCQTFYGNLFTEIVMTEGVILAKYAFQVAAGKEDRSAASGAADAWFFPRMEGSTCNF